MFYVYILKCCNGDLYVGSTNNLKLRIVQHESGETKSLKNKKFVLEGYIAVKTEKKARELEKYLKTGSGRAVIKKRILTDEALA
ncbi:MAG: GIY-YIG nuclease family protein [Candidatus Moranbacteria bacterium]|nr:GIY-YIG nuclease family protein [Candidatus Moranbacteria bacterium]